MWMYEIENSFSKNRQTLGTDCRKKGRETFVILFIFACIQFCYADVGDRRFRPGADARTTLMSCFLHFLNGLNDCVCMRVDNSSARKWCQKQVPGPDTQTYIPGTGAVATFWAQHVAHESCSPQRRCSDTIGDLVASLSPWSTCYVMIRTRSITLVLLCLVHLMSVLFCFVPL